MQRDAILSPCARYRYALARRWGPGPAVAFVGLNPSTADAFADDPTIRRCVGFARAWGFDSLVMLNLFAWRATQPADMQAADDPVGPQNNYFLAAHAHMVDLVVAAWGAGGSFRGRDAEVRPMLPRLHYLRLTKDGHPGHPLYLPATLRPVEWHAASVSA